MTDEASHAVEDCLRLRMTMLMAVRTMRMRHDRSISQHMRMFLHDIPPFFSCFPFLLFAFRTQSPAVFFPCIQTKREKLPFAERSLCQ